ncbi:putative extracellular protein [Streptococcus dysgalactiae subsp. dysgalactiae]|uniref:Putative extracellular protein n=1 Tax=Streptococcus dysgalactiae subsp. dysgalactiae TaxID=99822 RepID=A0A380JY67_STRDY|nr:SP_0009 family protein [Streptococcus dysgalactiae]SUN52029.1 putative extracellular protein [Streptococcus dysgalactiae subsp. dysgalactiae]
MMNDIITKIETFLAYSDEKLAELEKENQRLKEDNPYTETD